MCSRLIAAASSGDCNALIDLLREDPMILEKFPIWSSLEIPLHVASMLGHVDFVQKILEVSTSTSMKQLIQLNQDGFSPLHLAVTNGHMEMIMLLLEFGRASSIVEELCIKKDKDGKTPLHSACIRGEIDVLRALLEACLDSAFELTVQEETVLHLAVKYNQCEAFLYLVKHVNFGEFLNFPDCEGNTVLHLAAARKQFQTIEFLIRQTTLNINALNNYGLTGLDVLIMYSSNSKEIKIALMIRCAGGQRTLNQIQNQQYCTSNSVSGKKTNHIITDDHEETNNNNMPGISGLIVMVSLLATASLEMAINPPGGYWQDWNPNSNSTTASGAPPGIHKPGNAILFDLNRKHFKCFSFCNVQVFMTSISIIVFLVTPRSLKHESGILLAVRVATLWLVIMFVMLFYGARKFTTTGKFSVEPSEVVSGVFWSALNVCFVFSPLVSTLWKRLRKSRKYGALMTRF